MNIWAIGKDGKPLTVKQLSKIDDCFWQTGDDEIFCRTSKKCILEWIRIFEIDWITCREWTSISHWGMFAV